MPLWMQCQMWHMLLLSKLQSGLHEAAEDCPQLAAAPFAPVSLLPSAVADHLFGSGAGHCLTLQYQPNPPCHATAMACRWKATPIRQGEWATWFQDQMKTANKKQEKGLYISLRMDGRVRGSGVGSPPWERLAVALPPVSGSMLSVMLGWTCQYVVKLSSKAS